ncbi:pseudouridine synthase [Paenibacillus sp. 7541]|uniref:pseudouridine synthase n=1 Tax=Paenibacillus sp. 7541 TaxID=2026236 RepID=UPI000BA778DC|nr:pseudouridine synthase [Paenibacillus sp. 7541]PAK53545.1 pseudouridine synthase [Paenibacillus sp. 7541]
MERLQKIMAQAGVASRRKCEELILEGKVQVNGETVTELGTKADPEQDIITVSGKPIKNEKKVYLMLNKPKGVITSSSDPEGRRIVSDFLKGVNERVYPIGRLDYDTEGLLLLTNDGEFANMLSHPKYHVPKTYLATVKGVPHGTDLDRLRQGIMLEDGMTAPAEVEYKDVDPDNKFAVITITIHEGRNRQVRRMFDAISHPVTRLKRIAYGDLLLQNLKRGVYRHLTPDEINHLKQMAKAAKPMANPKAKRQKPDT